MFFVLHNGLEKQIISLHRFKTRPNLRDGLAWHRLREQPLLIFDAEFSHHIFKRKERSYFLLATTTGEGMNRDCLLTDAYLVFWIAPGQLRFVHRDQRSTYRVNRAGNVSFHLVSMGIRYPIS